MTTEAIVMNTVLAISALLLSSGIFLGGLAAMYDAYRGWKPQEK